MSFTPSASPDLYARPSADDASIRALLARLGGDRVRAHDLGGTMSLNLHAVEEGLVLRVHPRFVTAARLASLQAVRAHVACSGLLVPLPMEIDGSSVVPAGVRLAEVEPYLPSSAPLATWDSYLWMFEATGSLHGALASYGTPVPEPVVATYGTAASMRRDAVTTMAAVAADREAADVARRLLHLIDQLETTRVHSSRLPRQVVHGDIRLANVATAPDGAPVYFDFGFAATRPRMHDLAYALSWMVLRPDDSGCAEDFAWDAVPELLSAYEKGAAVTLRRAELLALGPLLAAVPLYLASIAGHTLDPVGHLRGELPFLRIAEWVLANTDEITSRLL